MRAIWAVTGRTAGAKNAAAASERNRRKGCPFKNTAFLNNTGRINLAPKKQERAKKRIQTCRILFLGDWMSIG
jgi:hypothetical protein